MLKLSRIGNSNLHSRAWPPINNVTDEGVFFDTEISAESLLKIYNTNPTMHKSMVMNLLSTVYANFFGYDDAISKLPTHDRSREIEIYKNKVILEEELYKRIIPSSRRIEESTCRTTESACEYLEYFSLNNNGISHEFFDFAEKDMTKKQWIEFLKLEVIRNEIVDDEVALMIPGLQHSMKQVVASNLWDECGNGHISGFHTHWLRTLLDETNLWEDLMSYRTSLPWFTSLASHSFVSLLTSFCGQYKSYGHFLITEGWVCPHFEKMVKGMNRVGFTKNKIQDYFTRHIKIDPHHAKEMIIGIQQMKPQLSLQNIREVIEGAHQAEIVGVEMYDNLLKYFNE